MTTQEDGAVNERQNASKGERIAESNACGQES